MSNIKIFDVNIENDKLENKFQEEPSIEELIDREHTGIMLREMVHNAYSDLEESCRAHHNAEVLLEAHRTYIDDPGLEAICSSEEAWNLTDTLKKTLTRFREFFNKAFEYVRNFVVLRLTAASGVIKKWAEILGDSNNKKDRIEAMKKEYDVKDCTIPQMVTVITTAQTAFNEIQKLVEQVKGLSPSSKSATDIEKMQVITELPSYKKFDEAFVAYEKSVPEGDNAGSTTAQPAEIGKWFDAGSVDGLYKEIDNVLIMLKNMKRMQASCDAIVTSLEKTSTDQDGTDKNVNDGKMKWLRDFSKNVMTSMIGRLTKLTSRAASKCQTLTNMYNK